MYSAPSANEMSQFHQQQLLAQQRQHQSTHQQAAHQQQLLHQQALAQAELRSRELSIQSAASHQQQGLSTINHAQHQSGTVNSVQNSSNNLFSHTSPGMYSLAGTHLGSSGGSISSAPMPNSLTNIAPHLTSINSSRPNMAPPTSNNLSRSSNNSSSMPPPRGAGNGMLPPSLIPSRGVKDRRSELQRKRDEAFLQRKRERESLERTKMEEERYSKALFDAPVKETSTTDDSRQVADILGDHSDVAQIINSSTVSCIGIDYQPPTPAASTNHHIIGGEDDEPPTNANSVVPDAQNVGMNPRRSGHIMHSTANYTFPRNGLNSQPPGNPYRNISRVHTSNQSDIGTNNPLRNIQSEGNVFGTSPSLQFNQPLMKPMTQQRPQISPEGPYVGNTSQQIPLQTSQRRQAQPLHKAATHQNKPQNSTQIHNRELINSARLMGASTQHPSYQQGQSIEDSTSHHASQSNHPLENMLRLSNNAVSSNVAHHRDLLSSSASESQMRGTSSHNTTAISTLSTNTSSTYNPGLKTRSPSSSVSSHISNKVKSINLLPPINIEVCFDLKNLMK